MLRLLNDRLLKLELELGLFDGPPLEVFLIGGGFMPDGINIGDTTHRGRVTCHVRGLADLPNTDLISSPQPITSFVQD